MRACMLANQRGAIVYSSDRIGIRINRRRGRWRDICILTILSHPMPFSFLPPHPTHTHVCARASKLQARWSKCPGRASRAANSLIGCGERVHDHFCNLVVLKVQGCNQCAARNHDHSRHVYNTSTNDAGKRTCPASRTGVSVNQIVKLLTPYRVRVPVCVLGLSITSRPALNGWTKRRLVPLSCPGAGAIAALGSPADIPGSVRAAIPSGFPHPCRQHNPELDCVNLPV